MAENTLKVPDIGSDSAEVVEILVAVGDEIAEEQSLLVLESDKASLEVPASASGTVLSLAVKVGDTLSQGDIILTVESSQPDTEAQLTAEPQPVSSTDTPSAPSEPADPPLEAVTARDVELAVPDIGGDGAEVVEILVAVGDEIAAEQSLVVLESDKASMEVPAVAAGTVSEIRVTVGDTVREGDVAIILRGPVAPEAPQPEPTQSVAPESPSESQALEPASPSSPVVEWGSSDDQAAVSSTSVYAGPAVRKLAREFGISLEAVTGSGPRGRILKEDLHAFVSGRLAAPATGGAIDPVPEVDFSQFGAVELEPRTRLDKLTADNMSRAWLNVPHVTQFDDADITELEAFRASLKPEAERRGTRISPLPFILKACAVALHNNPKLRSSLADGGSSLVTKDYCHIGMAVDTPAGLVVPVLRDVDKKSVWELASEVLELADKARARKLRPEQMQGAVFSVSSLGSIGGRGFTPIVNAPEVAILGVSRAGVQPVWDGSQFQPRTMLPVSLSYDHRVVNGGDAGRFLTQLVELLADIRRCLL